MMRDGDGYRIRANYGFSDKAVQYALNNPLQSDRGARPGVPHWKAGRVMFQTLWRTRIPRGWLSTRHLRYSIHIAIPLLREGTAIGARFTLTRDEVNPFTEKQKELATTFADQAVIAIENVRLFEEVQARTRDLTESLEQQTATSEVLEGHLKFAR